MTPWLQFKYVIAILFVSLGCQNIVKVGREPAAWKQVGSPCREARDCNSHLICQQGWCRQPQQKKEAYENCRSPQECRSLRCENQKCTPTNLVPADNGTICFAGLETNCRSQKMNVSGFCVPSSRFPGFPGMDCRIGPDCISQNCGPDFKCKPGPDSLSCAWITQDCENDRDCCSEICRDKNSRGLGKCGGRTVSSCLYGNCSDSIGKVCAGPNQPVRTATECCSLRSIGGFCVNDPNSRAQMCLVPEDCASGQTCHPKQKICTP